MDRNAGYVADVDYPYGYYRTAQPDLLALPCLNAGVMPPAGRPLACLELGVGKGLTINIHAAANAGAFWGTDINANYVAEALTVATASGSGARLLADSLAELAARTDLPEFDVIVMHGLWSWLTPENRRQVIELVRRRLRIGGLFYVSYNCYPGAVALDPVNQLMVLHADHAETGSVGTLGRLEEALRFVREMAGSDALYFREHPAAAKALAGMADRDRNQLAHEVMSRGRTIMTFASVADELADASLSFAASALLQDHFDWINLSPDGQKLLGTIRHPVLRQSVIDYLVNRHARFDIFVKGLRRLTTVERAEALHAVTFALMVDIADLRFTIRGARGEVGLDEGVYRPLVEVLAENQHEPKTLHRIAQHPKVLGIARGNLVEALLVLVSAGYASPAREPTAETRARCKALNRYLWDRARTDGEIAWLASPVAGGGVPASRFEQLFAAAVSAGRESIADQAGIAWKILSAQGQHPVKDGRTLQSPEENIAHLTTMATQFNDRRLRIFRMLEVV